MVPRHALLAVCAAAVVVATAAAPPPTRFPRPAKYDTSARRKEGTSAAPVVNVHLVPHTHGEPGAACVSRRSVLFVEPTTP